MGSADFTSAGDSAFLVLHTKHGREKADTKMAQRVQVLLVCDLHEGDEEGTETIAFSLDGAAYEIDVCDAHAAELRDAFAPYVGQARRAGRSAPAGGRRRAT